MEQRPAHPSEWAALQAVATKLGTTAETLRKWVRQAERDTGQRPGLTTSERERLSALERLEKIVRGERRKADRQGTLATGARPTPRPLPHYARNRQSRGPRPASTTARRLQVVHHLPDVVQRRFVGAVSGWPVTSDGSLEVVVVDIVGHVATTVVHVALSTKRRHA